MDDVAGNIDLDAIQLTTIAKARWTSRVIKFAAESSFHTVFECLTGDSASSCNHGHDRCTYFKLPASLRVTTSVADPVNIDGL